jgi:hypothetical protein
MIKVNNLITLFSEVYMSKFLFLIVLSTCALVTTNAEAFRVSVFPSFTFRSSNSYPCRQVVAPAPVMQVHSYIDCYGRQCFYEVPVYPYGRVVNSYPQSCYRGTDFQLQFRIN